MHNTQPCPAAFSMTASILTGFALLLAGCAPDNGLPRELVSHFRARGVSLRPTRTHAPLSGRSGFVVVKADPALASRITATFGLETVANDDPRALLAMRGLGCAIPITEIRGIRARPPQLKLKSGAQFEYLFLVLTPSGELYLFTEYAYG